MFQPQTLSDRAQIEARRDEHMGRLLQRAWRVFNTQAIAKLRGRGHGGLTLAHTALLANLDLDGTRITALAERAGMTKQSMGQLALDLEAHGYVTRAPDPTDRRATLVRFTERGGQFLRDASVIKDEIEAEWAAVLGVAGMDDLRALLTRLIAHDAPAP